MYQPETRTIQRTTGDSSVEQPSAPDVPQTVELPDIGDVVGGRYRIERRLGQGGMGVVFRAENLATGCPVALKWLLPERHSVAAMQRLLREARATGRVLHPNIVDVYDVGEHRGRLFLVMQLLQGDTLAEELARRGRMPLQEVLRVMLPVMHAVQAAHRAGVVHRDLKPSNIILHATDEHSPPLPIVVDFGVSKVLGPDSDGDCLSLTGGVLGTPYYMAPEQLDEAQATDGRVDIYAMGVVLYELLVGVRPYQAQSLSTLALQVHRGDHPSIHTRRPELPDSVCEMVNRAMQVKPGDRFRDVGEMIACASRLAGVSAPLAGAAREPTRRTLPRRAGPWLLAGAIALAVQWLVASDAFAPGDQPTANTLEGIPAPHVQPPGVQGAGARAQPLARPIAPPGKRHALGGAMPAHAQPVGPPSPVADEIKEPPHAPGGLPRAVPEPPRAHRARKVPERAAREEETAAREVPAVEVHAPKSAPDVEGTTVGTTDSLPDDQPGRAPEAGGAAEAPASERLREVGLVPW